MSDEKRVSRRALGEARRRWRRRQSLVTRVRRGEGLGEGVSSRCGRRAGGVGSQARAAVAERAQDERMDVEWRVRAAGQWIARSSDLR